MGKKKKTRGSTDEEAVRALLKKAAKLDGRSRETGAVAGIIRDGEGASAASASMELAQFGFVVRIWSTDGSGRTEEMHVDGPRRAEKFLTGTARKWAAAGQPQVRESGARRATGETA